jgi:hypothetical protein
MGRREALTMTRETIGCFGIGGRMQCEAPGCSRDAEYVCRGTDCGETFVARCCEAHAIYLSEDDSDDTYEQERIVDVS